MTSDTVQHMDSLPSPPGDVTAIAFIGFGEAAAAFVQGWRDAATGNGAASAFDVKTQAEAAAVRTAKWDDYARRGITGHETPDGALAGAGLVFSLVTADQAFAAADSAASVITAGALYLDGNSCAPDTKRRSAAIIEAAGGRYVDMAVMAPVHPKLHRTPVLLSGPHAAQAQAALAALDMTADIAEGDVGTAWSIKMIHSIMVKGMEAVDLECFLAARKAGVDEPVIASLEATYPDFDWRGRGAYMMERVTTHGVRRAAEMRESRQTLKDLGLSGAMTAGTVDWQQLIGVMDLSPGPNDYGLRADAILARLADEGDDNG